MSTTLLVNIYIRVLSSVDYDKVKIARSGLTIVSNYGILGEARWLIKKMPWQNSTFIRLFYGRRYIN
jgi:hypothetical protein